MQCFCFLCTHAAKRGKRYNTRGHLKPKFLHLRDTAIPKVFLDELKHALANALGGLKCFGGIQLRQISLQAIKHTSAVLHRAHAKGIAIAEF